MILHGRLTGISRSIPVTAEDLGVRDLPLVSALGSLILAARIVIAVTSEIIRRRGKLTEQTGIVPSPDIENQLMKYGNISTSAIVLTLSASFLSPAAPVRADDTQLTYLT